MKKPPKILIIDDDPSICQIFERFLTANDYEVLTSNNEEKGLSLLRTEFFNLILLDINLPGIDGLSILPKIKSFSPDTEVIMATGSSNTETAIQSFQLVLLRQIIPCVILSDRRKRRISEKRQTRSRFFVALLLRMTNCRSSIRLHIKNY